MHKLQILLILGCMLLELATGAGVAKAQQVTYSGSMQYATGSYIFTERTGSLYIMNGLSISGDRGSVSFTVPYVIQNSPWISYTHGGGIPTGGSRHGQVGRDENGTISIGLSESTPDISAGIGWSVRM